SGVTFVAGANLAVNSGAALSGFTVSKGITEEVLSAQWATAPPSLAACQGSVWFMTLLALRGRLALCGGTSVVSRYIGSQEHGSSTVDDLSQARHAKCRCSCWNGL